MKKIVANVSDVAFKKLKKKKGDDDFATATWGKWLESWVKDAKIHDTADDIIGKSTTKNLGPLWMKNLARNLPHVLKGNSAKDLVDTEEGKSSIIVGAGPSIWKHKHLELLARTRFDGVICATDRMLIPLLKKKIIPDYVCSIDGHPEFIRNFYRHKLVRKHALEIKAILGLYVSPNVTRYLKRIGMPIYWFSPSSKETIIMLTASKKNPNGLIALKTGGNTGTTTFVFSWVILKTNPNCLIGFDFGYPEGTNLEKTPYYSSALRALPNKTEASVSIAQIYEPVYHPVFKTKSLIDPVFKRYRHVLLTALRDDLPDEIKVYNCTEGGTLFGDRVECVRFSDFLCL